MNLLDKIKRILSTWNPIFASIASEHDIPSVFFTPPLSNTVL